MEQAAAGSEQLPASQPTAGSTRRTVGVRNIGATLVAGGLLAAAAVLQVAATSAQATASVLDGAYTEAQATRGETLYFENCASCHGPALEGGDMTPGLTGAIFLANWNDLTLGDLSERIRISMPLDRPGKLSRQQTADVIAFVLKANKWPAGERDLPTDTASLKQIKIESARR